MTENSPSSASRPASAADATHDRDGVQAGTVDQTAQGDHATETDEGIRTDATTGTGSAQQTDPTTGTVHTAQSDESAPTGAAPAREHAGGSADDSRTDLSGFSPTPPHATHSGPTGQASTYQLSPGAQQGSVRTFRRSRTDRMIAGVCGGAAEFLGVDAVILRLALIAATLLGFGLGILLYLACWVVVPQR